MLASKEYPPSCLYNMDEAGFEAAFARKTRKIGPKSFSGNHQAVPSASNGHITVIACIGVDRAPVPPVVIFTSQATGAIPDTWTPTTESSIRQLAIGTDSGWINSHVMLVWLKDAFDPATRDLVPPGAKRLLFLDGHESHVKVEFLEACWALNIVCVILPANMSGVFQPLDVDFFNHLKGAYHRQVQDYQLGAPSSSINKGMFWTFHQAAWKATATSQQCRAAWRKSGIWPLSAEVMGANQPVERPVTPPLRTAQEPETPLTIRTIKSNNRAVRQGDMDALAVLHKTEKALEISLARNALQERRIMSLTAAQDLDKVTRGSRKTQRFPTGQLFDPLYQLEHAEELSKRKAQETEAKNKKKAKARRTEPTKAPSIVQSPEAGSSTQS